MKLPKDVEERFDERFMNPDPFDSANQFKEEVLGRLPGLLKEFIAVELRVQEVTMDRKRLTAINNVIRQVDDGTIVVKDGKVTVGGDDNLRLGLDGLPTDCEIELPIGVAARDIPAYGERQDDDIILCNNNETI